VKRAAAVLVFLLFAAPAAAESVRIETRAVPAKTTLGSEVKLFVTVEHPRDYAVTPPAAKNFPKPFEVKRVDVFPPRGKNRVRDTFVYTLTAFEIGKFTVPALEVVYRDDRGPERSEKTPPVEIEITGAGGKLPAQARLKPIKGPVALPKDALRATVLGAFAALLGALLAVKVVLRRRSRPKIDPDSLRSPHERAELELERLDESGLESEGKWKELYAGFSGVMRRYLERGLGVDSADRTTSEVVADLKAAGRLAPGVVDRIRETLENADLVKFAKFVPPRETTAGVKRAILEVVRLTKPDDGGAAPKGKRK